MAQIGSPSAGWYTDPSGQHLARYWDGATWTEQVRDDLTEPAHEPAAPTSAPAAPNPVADTVAGVAEAVAAVAANDAARTPEPMVAEAAFVVDYGADGPWNGTSGTGDGAAASVTDAHASVASPAPTPFPTGDAPVTMPVVDLPATTAPVAGWYPDPAGRHQARLWDGTRWTERVADGGQEGIDPLPGVAPATVVSPTAPDPVDGASPAWTMEATPAPVGDLADLADLAGDTGATGAAMSAGQASLASLPKVDEPETDAERTWTRPSVKVRVAGTCVFGGAVALLVGSAMSWMKVRGLRVGDEWSSTGLDLGDGRITVALGIVLAVLGAGIITGRMARFGGTKVGAMGALVAGAAALAVTAVDIADVADRASRLGVPADAVSNVGNGLWLAFLGALFAVGGGLMAFANRE